MMGTATKASMQSNPPFGSFEAFLFEVMTLRSNAAYRSDIEMLMMCEEEPKDWITHFEVYDRPFQAARNVIAVWELICSVVRKHYLEEEGVFLDTVQGLGSMYLWMKPVIDKIKDGTQHPAPYAESFLDLGKKAAERLPAFTSERDAAAAGTDFNTLSAARQHKVFRSAARKLRPLTHFG
jgi:hypothetical protein